MSVWIWKKVFYHLQNLSILRAILPKMWPLIIRSSFGLYHSDEMQKIIAITLQLISAMNVLTQWSESRQNSWENNKRLHKNQSSYKIARIFFQNTNSYKRPSNIFTTICQITVSLFYFLLKSMSEINCKKNHNTFAFGINKAYFFFMAKFGDYILKQFRLLGLKAVKLYVVFVYLHFSLFDIVERVPRICSRDNE